MIELKLTVRITLSIVKSSIGQEGGRRGVSDLNATVGDYLLVLEHNPVPSGAEASHWSFSFFYLGTVVCD